MKYSLFFILLLINICAICQNSIFKAGPLKIQDYLRLEGSLKSTLIKDSVEYSSTDPNLLPPIRYYRQNINFPIKPIVEYYFSIQDSIVHQIYFNIEIRDSLEDNFLKMVANKIDVNDTFNKEYEHLKDELINLFGNATETERLQEKTFKQYFYWERYDNWVNDYLNCKLYLMLDEKDKTYEIRLAMIFK